MAEPRGQKAKVSAPPSTPVPRPPRAPASVRYRLLGVQLDASGAFDLPAGTTIVHANIPQSSTFNFVWLIVKESAR